jgi:glutamine amidotransferase
MTSKKIVVVDYGVGNLYSVQRALEHSGAENVCVSSSVEDIATADSLILPGVGAFEDGMRGLTALGLVEPIKKHALKNKPLLGICLGMQLLATESEEFGNHSGLGMIQGKVVHIPKECADGSRRKVPFIGWSNLNKFNQAHFEDKILEFNNSESAVYFVHSYHFLPKWPNNILATYNFQGTKITAAIKSKNIYGFQFHPEKSGEIGINILKKFIKIDY